MTSWYRLRMAGGYVCTACGNRTRFDVVSTRRTRAYHHYDLGGQLRVEDETVLSEVTEEVVCRWCEHGGAVELLSSGDASPGVPQGQQ